MAKKGGLGMGLDAIFDDNTLDDKESIRHVRLTDIEPNKNQPRKNFDEAEIQKLAESISEHGLIQPIIVRPIADERYQIVAGERRWRACKVAGISEIPIIVRELTDEDTAKIALIENIQRADLNPIEEAAAYKQLIDNYGITQEALAKMVGKSRSVIANSVRLLNLPERVQDMLKNDEITVGHAKALAGIDDEGFMIEVAERAANGLLTVRNIERIAAEYQTKNDEDVSDIDELDKKVRNYYTEVELSLTDRLGRKVKITPGRDGKGSISIDFFNKDDLSGIADLLKLL
ncbi:MAG: ParB/RepB/Spo0J family partition protein [Oscillospiraceae bacterium]|nr:ParB/RepB/Spo0J family partition protein [Oscillospiraceae bacterium]MDY2847630.1 ParB/RepB/Spo0J family partition protein [Oscillospiraceae bacterium]